MSFFEFLIGIFGLWLAYKAGYLSEKGYRRRFLKKRDKDMLLAIGDYHLGLGSRFGCNIEDVWVLKMLRFVESGDFDGWEGECRDFVSNEDAIILFKSVTITEDGWGLYSALSYNRGFRSFYVGLVSGVKRRVV